MILKAIFVGRLHTNCYLVACERTREALVIDPGAEERKILGQARNLDVQIRQIALTHFHFDHILAVKALLAETGATLAIHQDDAPLLSNPPALFRVFTPDASTDLAVNVLLHDGDEITMGDLTLRVLATPGHSPGGISLWLPKEKVIFVGDTWFREGIGRTDFPGCDQATLLRSIRERLFALPDETVVYPGHGPHTTIGHEKRHNPWLNGSGT